MLKKYSSLILLFTASAILLGHSIIPHHHHHDENSDEVSHRHDLIQQHESEDCTDGLNQLLSNIIHPEDGFSFLTNQNFSDFLSKHLVSIAAVLHFDFAFKTVDLFPLPDRPPADHPNSYSFFLSCTFGLRAPPAL